jgi:Kef-type K+ transport system membrane component KefB
MKCSGYVLKSFNNTEFTEGFENLSELGLYFFLFEAG